MFSDILAEMTCIFFRSFKKNFGLWPKKNRHTDDWKNSTCCLSNPVLGVNGVGARKSFARGAAIDLPPMQQGFVSLLSSIYLCGVVDESRIFFF